MKILTLMTFAVATAGLSFAQTPIPLDFKIVSVQVGETAHGNLQISWTTTYESSGMVTCSIPQGSHVNEVTESDGTVAESHTVEFGKVKSASCEIFASTSSGATATMVVTLQQQKH